jgi:hypothetical protein
MTEKWTKEAIREKLKTDDLWLRRAVVAIFEQQTSDERSAGMTVEDNGMGFNGSDAPSMSRIAQQIQRDGFLDYKNVQFARKKMLKYAGQLANLANAKARGHE